jgi:hypothetical protein
MTLLLLISLRLKVSNSRPGVHREPSSESALSPACTEASAMPTKQDADDTRQVPVSISVTARPYQ